MSLGSSGSSEGAVEPDAEASAVEPERVVAIRLRGLERHFARQPVLSGVSLDVARGELLVVLGPSGSGKTTLLRILAGLDQQDAGTVELDGRDASFLSPQERNFGVVFQEQALFQRMSVERNIAFGLEVRREPKQRIRTKVDEMLALIRLGDHRWKLPSQLSGGQRQRVALARALAFQPAAMLFDEPFSALDAVTRVELRREVKSLLHSLAMPAIFITHDQEEALELADRIAILNHGRVEQVGTPWQVYNRPATEFVATFLGAANVLIGTWRPGFAILRAVRLATNGDAHGFDDGQAIKVVFRPEDVLLRRDARDLPVQRLLGQGRVDEISYIGAVERLVLRLEFVPWRSDPVAKVSPGVGYDGAQPITVTRSKWEAQELPLIVGDEVEVGLKDFRMLAHYPLRSDRGSRVD
jgi:ABC-type Fe3+/spermidine/putrescine transport system ATPase subunit